MSPQVVLIALVISTCCLQLGIEQVYAEELPPAKNVPNKTKILKQSIQRSAKYCSSLHETTTANVLLLILAEVDDQEGKCFLHCMLQSYQLMDDQGNYHREKLKGILDYIPDSAFLRSIKRNISTCKNERGSTPCESAYKFIRCFYLKAREQNKVENEKATQSLVQNRRRVWQPKVAVGH